MSRSEERLTGAAAAPALKASAKKTGESLALKAAKRLNTFNKAKQLAKEMSAGGGW
jgi:hypothetical protein